MIKKQPNKFWLSVLKLFDYFDATIRFIKLSWFLSITIYITTDFLQNKILIMDSSPLQKGLTGCFFILGYLLFLMDTLKRV